MTHGLITDETKRAAEPSNRAASETPLVPAVSASLLAAAIGGLLCMSGCGDGSDDKEGEERRVTLSREDASWTKEKFEDACDTADGKLEVHPHCGGANSCKGFSYDTDTGVYSEHTCMGLNTCTGYSCVVPDEA